MREDIILETEDLTKEFAGFVAVNGVNLRVARGTIHALIGPNGAGKTTCFNLLTKFLQPTRGQHRLQGPGHHRARAGRRCAARPRCARSRFRRCFRISRVLENVRIALQRKRGGSFDFWRSTRVARSVQRARAGADRRRRPRRLRATCRRSNCPMAASARSRSRPRWRSIRRCCCSTSRPPAWAHEDIERIAALIKRVAAERTVLMVEHNLSRRREPVRPHHRADARPSAGRGRLRRPCRTIPRCAKPIWGPVMLDARTAAACRSRTLQAWYGESHILHGVTFDVRQGEVVTLLGRNGAGKTTTLKSIMGIVATRTARSASRGAS